MQLVVQSSCANTENNNSANWANKLTATAVMDVWTESS